jgi:hypothetical protein
MMESCGNRAKARRFYERGRQSADANRYRRNAMTLKGAAFSGGPQVRYALPGARCACFCAVSASSIARKAKRATGIDPH